MNRCTFAFVALLLGLIGTARAQESPKINSKKDEAKAPVAPGGQQAAKPEPTDVEVHFINGSLLRLLVHTEKLEIDTDYGRLSVPVQDIRSIEFGLRFPEGVAAKIQAAIHDLGADEFRARDRAVKTLVQLGPYSFPAALDASRSKTLEISRRGKEVLTQLDAKFDKKDLKTTELDRIVARSFPITGRILTSSIKAKTDLFGDVELALAKMGTLRSVARAGQGDSANLTVDAAKYAIFGNWMETSIHADGRTALKISAKGAVDTWPQGPNQYMSGPNGVQGGRVMVQGGGFGGGGLILRGGGNPAAMMNMQMNGGALYGRIGEDGEPFFVGERYHGTPEGEGKLYLTIAPSPWGCQSTGKYEVTIAH